MDGGKSEVVDWLVRWAEEHPLIRALLLTSSRARPHARVDRLSDYDVIVVASDLRPFTRDDGWLKAYDEPLVLFRDAHTSDGIESHARLVLYEDGTKVDYSIWPAELVKKAEEAPRLPDQLDVGYGVLVDKDGLTAALRPPTYTAHIPPKPTEAEFLDLVGEFWWETTYVAKNLWRDELLPAKYSFEAVMKFDLLRRMLEWYVESDRDWSLKPGVLGRGLKGLLPPDVWERVERTFVGADPVENWEALFGMTELFREIATQVGARLGYAYPLELDRRMVRYLSGIRRLER